MTINLQIVCNIFNNLLLSAYIIEAILAPELNYIILRVLGHAIQLQLIFSNSLQYFLRLFFPISQFDIQNVGQFVVIDDIFKNYEFIAAISDWISIF